MCHQLYKRMWQDLGCVRVGRGGQSQSGVDILGACGGKSVGVQCKHYNKKPFAMGTITDDIEKADRAGLSIDHLLFATTAGSEPNIIVKVRELSEQRQRTGKFAVSIDFWGDICGHLQMHPEVGRSFIKNFPGSIALETLEVSLEVLSASQQREVSADSQHAMVLSAVQETQNTLYALTNKLLSPEASGNEADPLVVAKLDTIRDALLQGRTRDASKVLDELGDPSNFRDQFSKFRWYTNWSSIELAEGRTKAAAEGYLQAFAFAKDNEKAAANRAHAFLLLCNAESSLAACDQGLLLFPDSAYLWSVKVHALQQLGAENPELAIPENLRESHELLFSVARIFSKKKDFQKAVRLLKKCLDSDGGSFEAKRSLLVEALEWAAQDPVQASYSHLSAEKRDALVDAVQRLEPLEQNLSSIQSDCTSEEVVCNVANALAILGKNDRAQGICSIFLPKHPLSAALLRLRILRLAESRDTNSIRDITNNVLGKLPLAILAIIAEVSAGEGDLVWHEQIQETIKNREDNADRLSDVGVLRFQAQWASGDKGGAIEGVKAHLKDNPNHVMTRIFLAEFYARNGRNEEAIIQGEACLPLVQTSGSTFDKFQLAELFFRLENYEHAAQLYESLVTSPSNDELTVRLLTSLVETDQRKKAQLILEDLSPAARQDHKILRIECNLARRMSDWPRLKDLLSLESIRLPGSAEIGVAYAGTLYRLGEVQALHTYLQSDPKFKHSSPESEFEFAKHQLDAGFTLLALNRLYCLYRTNPDSTKVAGFYLSQLLLAPITNELCPPEVIGPGTAVRLKTQDSSWWVLIDQTGVSGTWPELVSTDSVIASKLSGRRVGEILSVDRGFSTLEVEVVEIKSAFSFAADKASSRLEASASQEGPLWSFSAYKPSGELDIDTISTSVRERRISVEAAFENYKKNRLPLCVLARLVGTDAVSLLLEWPFEQYDLFVGIGTEEERERSRSFIESSKKRYVLDLTAIAELTKLGIFDAIVKRIDVPLVAQSARDELVSVIQLHKRQMPTASLTELDGKICMFDVDPKIYADRTSLLERILRNIDKCEVCPTLGPKDIEGSVRKLANLLDDHVVDSFYLCVERDAVLIAQDGALRQIAFGFGVSALTGIQPLLMAAYSNGAISLTVYANAVADMIKCGRNFVSVRSEDLVHLAKAEPNQLSSKVKTMLDTCRHSTVDLISAIKVSLDFIEFVAAKLPVRIAAGYVRYVYSVLGEGRPELREKIADLISHQLQAVYGRNGRRVNITDRIHFNGLLKRQIDRPS